MPTSLTTFLGDISPLKVEETRLWAEDRVEIVGIVAELGEWTKRLEPFLGPPLKPSGEKPSPDLERRTAAWGGIWKNQVFYEKKHPDQSIVALIWPWGDKTHFTLKIFSSPTPS
jgi:hypothetical protein